MISSLQTDCSWNNFNPNTQLRHDCGHSSLCDLMCNSHMHINQAQQSIDEASLYYNPSTNCIWTMDNLSIYNPLTNWHELTYDAGYNNLHPQKYKSAEVDTCSLSQFCIFIAVMFNAHIECVSCI